MRLLLASVFVAASLLACAGSDSVIVVSGDGGTGAGNGSTSTCTVQPDTDRAQLCGSATNSTLLSCKGSTPPPFAACTRALLPDSYCCSSEGLPADGGSDTGSSSDLNPYGVPYPTDHLGVKERSGAARGDRVKNLRFQGYKAGSTTLGSVSLADLYDPDGMSQDVVFLVGGTQWSAPDQATLGSLKASNKRIATLAVLGEGTSQGQAATLTNLSTYRTKNSFATTALDAGFTILGAFFDGSAVPFVMVIDARTMEIASAGVGGLTTVSQVDSAVTAVTSRAAAY